MSYTNGVIPDKCSIINKLIDDKALLNFKLQAAENKASGYLAMLQNVFISVKENGFIDLKDESTGEKITLVEKTKGHHR